MPALILLLLQVCGVIWGKLPHLFNEGLGRLTAEDPLGPDVQFPGREAGLPVCRAGAAPGVSIAGRVWPVLTRFPLLLPAPRFPFQLSCSQTPDPQRLSEIINVVLSFFGGNLSCSNK